MNRVAYADIPQTMRDLLDEVYEAEGVELWWNSRHRNFDLRRPADLWRESPEGRAQIQQWVEYLTGGAW